MSITATIFWFVKGVLTWIAPTPQKESLGPQRTTSPSKKMALEEKAKAGAARPEEAKEVNGVKPDEATTEE